MAATSGTTVFENKQEQLPQPKKPKDKVLLDERGLLDLPFLALTVLLVLIGVIMMFSASYARAYQETGKSTYYFARQAIFAVLGIGVMLFISRLNYQMWRFASFIVLGVSVFFLLLVPFIGEASHGAKRWITVAGIRFQPSELAKVAIVMSFASLMSIYREKMQTFRYGILPFAAILVVICGLVALERHFSCILIMLALGAVMMFLGGVRLRWFVAGGVLVGIFAVIYLTRMGYAGDRVTAWRDPASDPTDTGYHAIALRHRLRRPDGSGTRQGAAEIPVFAGGAQRLHFPHRLRGAGLRRGDGGDFAVRAADPARVLDRDARARSLRRADGGGPDDASGPAGVFEHRRHDELPARDGYFAPVLLLRRHGAAYPAVRNGPDPGRFETK